MSYTYNDAGRVAAGFKGNSDCGVRAVALACGLGYKEARTLLREYSNKGKLGSRAISRGIYKEDMTSALNSIGWVWMSAPKFDGRKARFFDLPKGRVIARMARHFVAVIDGELMDVFDSSEKMIYGYWMKA